MRRALPTQTWCSVSLGEACLHAGRAEEAREIAGRSLVTARRTGERGTQARSLSLLGEIAARSEPAVTRTQPQNQYREALALGDELGMRPLVAHCHLGLGRLYRRSGASDQAHEHLTTATTMYREMDMPFWLKQAEQEMRGAGRGTDVS